MPRFIHSDGSLTPEFHDSQTAYYLAKGFKVYIPEPTKCVANAQTEAERCQATTHAGTQCKRRVVTGTAFCDKHQPVPSED